MYLLGRESENRGSAGLKVKANEDSPVPYEEPDERFDVAARRLSHVQRAIFAISAAR
jgi:hypothetical protein